MNKKFKEKAMYLKMCFSRAMSYVAILNFLMLSYLTILELNINKILLIAIWIIAVSGVMLFGFIEVRAGFFKQEQVAWFEEHPIFMEMIERIRKIEDKLNGNNKT